MVPLACLSASARCSLSPTYSELSMARSKLTPDVCLLFFPFFFLASPGTTRPPTLLAPSISFRRALLASPRALRLAPPRPTPLRPPAQREESIAKRRHFVSDDSDPESEADEAADDAKLVHELPQMISAVFGGEVELQVEATTKFRKWVRALTSAQREAGLRAGTPRERVDALTLAPIVRPPLDCSARKRTRRSTRSSSAASSRDSSSFSRAGTACSSLRRRGR